MVNDIDTYLRELQEALSSAGADPALVQDALFDAEEYLRAEMAVGGALERGTATYEARFATVSDAYGTPEEVAAAYMGAAPAQAAPVTGTAPATAAAPPAAGAEAGAVPGTAGAPVAPTLPVAPTPPVEPVAPGWVPGPQYRPAPGYGQPPYGQPPYGQGQAPYYGQAPYFGPPPGVQAGIAAAGAGGAAAPGAWQQIFGVFADPAVYKALVYMILSLATGITYFTLVVTGVSTAGGMLVLIVGLPLFLLVLGMVRAISLLEGRLVEGLLGTRMPRRERAAPPNANLLERMWFWVKDGRTWASMAYMILMLPLGIIYFTVTVTGLAAGLGLITSIAWGWVATWDFVYNGVAHHGQFPVWGIPIAVVVGVFVLTGTMHLIRWMGRGHASFAKSMLVRLAK